jgi:hypothetical protein
MLWNPHGVRVPIENHRRFAFAVLLAFYCHRLECVAGIKIPCLEAKSRLLDDERLLRMLRLLWRESRRQETARRRLAVMIVNTQEKERMIESVEAVYFQFCIRSSLKTMRRSRGSRIS